MVTMMTGIIFSVKEQRSAALDLANMAASSVDNKFAVVAEGGWVITNCKLLIRYPISATVQEYPKHYVLIKYKPLQNMWQHSKII